MSKMKSGWDFSSAFGFTGSAGKTQVKGYMRGGSVKLAKGGKFKKEGSPDKDEPSGERYEAKRGGPIKKAKGGSMKDCYAMGGQKRPMGMPRAPMPGMKRVRHAPGQTQMPGIPGMPPMGSSPIGMGAGTAPRVMKKGGKC